MLNLIILLIVIFVVVIPLFKFMAFMAKEAIQIVVLGAFLLGGLALFMAVRDFFLPLVFGGIIIWAIYLVTKDNKKPTEEEAKVEEIVVKEEGVVQTGVLKCSSPIDNIVYREVIIEIYDNISDDEKFYSAVIRFIDPAIIKFMEESVFDLPLFGGVTMNELVGESLVIGFDCRRSTEPKSKEFVLEESIYFIDYVFEKYAEEEKWGEK